MRRAIRTRVVPGNEGWFSFVLIKSEFRKEWKLAQDILKEKPKSFKFKIDAEQYATLAVNKFNEAK